MFIRLLSDSIHNEREGVRLYWEDTSSIIHHPSSIIVPCSAFILLDVDVDDWLIQYLPVVNLTRLSGPLFQQKTKKQKNQKTLKLFAIGESHAASTMTDKVLPYKTW